MARQWSEMVSTTLSKVPTNKEATTIALVACVISNFKKCEKYRGMSKSTRKPPGILLWLISTKALRRPLASLCVTTLTGTECKWVRVSRCKFPWWKSRVPFGHQDCTPMCSFGTRHGIVSKDASIHYQYLAVPKNPWSWTIRGQLKKAFWHCCAPWTVWDRLIVSFGSILERSMQDSSV